MPRLINNRYAIIKCLFSSQIGQVHLARAIRATDLGISGDVLMHSVPKDVLDYHQLTSHLHAPGYQKHACHDLRVLPVLDHGWLNGMACFVMQVPDVWSVSALTGQSHTGARLHRQARQISAHLHRQHLIPTADLSQNWFLVTDEGALRVLGTVLFPALARLAVADPVAPKMPELHTGWRRRLCWIPLMTAFGSLAALTMATGWSLQHFNGLSDRGWPSVLSSADAATVDAVMTRGALSTGSIADSAMQNDAIPAVSPALAADRIPLPFSENPLHPSHAIPVRSGTDLTLSMMPSVMPLIADGDTVMESLPLPTSPVATAPGPGITDETAADSGVATTAALETAPITDAVTSVERPGWTAGVEAGTAGAVLPAAIASETGNLAPPVVASVAALATDEVAVPTAIQAPAPLRVLASRGAPVGSVSAGGTPARAVQARDDVPMPLIADTGQPATTGQQAKENLKGSRLQAAGMDREQLVRNAQRAIQQGRLDEHPGRGAVYFIRLLRRIEPASAEVRHLARDVTIRYHDQARREMQTGDARQAGLSLWVAHRLINEFNLVQLNPVQELLKHRLAE